MGDMADYQVEQFDIPPDDFDTVAPDLGAAAAAAGLRLVPAAPPSQIAAVEAVRSSGSTAVEVAARLDITIEAAAMRLRRAFDRGLLKRRREWPAFIYYQKEATL